ncbi:hypothetical protein [Microbacterium sp. A93]|uniref:hypothetical protein n=1 Tax=Microbacterium sp. A93 TaxID=3450716 RepID=UPI003F4381BC
MIAPVPSDRAAPPPEPADVPPLPGDLPTYLVVGPARHGVVRHARSTAAALHRLGVRVPVVDLPDATALRGWAAGRDPSAGPVHVDVTDALFGASPDEAVAALTAALPARTTLTLHDVPQPAEGADRFARRARAYTELMRWAAGAVVSSRHELTLLDELLPGGLAGTPHGPTAVVPLPVEDRRGSPTQGPDGAGPGGAHPAGGSSEGSSEGLAEGLAEDVVLLGFLYPGKGHAEALDALALLRESGVPAPRRVTALGAVASGHEPLVDELRGRAHAAGLDFRVTGFVPDGALDSALRSAGIPFAAHHNVSASGSLTAWMSVGRRAVVPSSRYARGMERLRPGTLQLVEPAGGESSAVAALAAGIAAASADPGLTRLEPTTSLAPGPEDSARLLTAFWRQVHG